MSTSPQLQPRVLRPSEIQSHDRGGGAKTTPLVSPAIGAQDFINGEFAPGAAIPFHSQNCEESAVLDGNARLDIDRKGYPVKSFETTWIPPNMTHRFRNLCDTLPMKILWIYASTQATRTVTATGRTRLVSAEQAR